MHSLFRSHFATMLKLLPQMPIEILHFLRGIQKICDISFPFRSKKSQRHSQAKRTKGDFHLMQAEEQNQQIHKTAIQDDVLFRLISTSVDDRKLQQQSKEDNDQQQYKQRTITKSIPKNIMQIFDNKPKKTEINHGIELPKDFVQPLGPMFNFFFLSFIVSGKKIQIDKQISNQMDAALTVISKIIMVIERLFILLQNQNICYMKKFEQDDIHELFMMNGCISDWHRDLGYIFMKTLQQGAGISYIEDQTDAYLSRSLTQNLEEEQYIKTICDSKGFVPMSLVKMDYDVIMRCLNLLQGEEENFKQMQMEDWQIMNKIDEEFSNQDSVREILKFLVASFV